MGELSLRGSFYFIVILLLFVGKASSSHHTSLHLDKMVPVAGARATAWISGPGRSFFGRTISRRTLGNGSRRFFAAAGSSAGDNNNTHHELQSKLRQLALLNGGKSINPRSPRQVSNLLYGNNSIYDLYSTKSGARSNMPLGPTDKATLQRIILRDAADEDEDKQKQVATLVLQCRELLSSNGQNLQSFVGVAEGSGSGISNKQTTSRVANFSNVAAASSNDIIGELDDAINGHVQEEEVVPLVDNGVDDTIVASSTFSFPSSPYERMVMDLFPTCPVDGSEKRDDNIQKEDALDPYWMEPLLSITKSSARSLVRQLQSTSCPMGYDQSASPITSLISNNNNTASPAKRTTSLLSYIRNQKSTYFSDAIVLVRVGDFYETYGIDAIMLVEHCGLNPMAGKARAGCPWKNVQSTLDGLTGAGFRVAVYEEWNGGNDGELAEMILGDGDAGKGGSKLKKRYLAQVVSSANPTYMHGLVLKDDSSATDDSSASHGDTISLSSPGRSYVGVIETQAGYTLVEISSEERTVVVSERLTAEAVSCRLVAYPPADPLFYVPPYSDESGSSTRRRLDRLPFLPWRQTSSPLIASQRYSQSGDFGVMMGKVRVKTLPPSLVVGHSPDLTDVERAKQTIVSAFLRLEDDSISAPSSLEESTPSSPLRKQQRRVVTHDDFVIVASAGSQPEMQSHLTVTKTHPLHLETATQLGLMSDPAIHPLVSSLLPDSAPSSSRRFLRRWLLIPPPPDIADAMSQLVGTLTEDNRALPSLNAPPLTGKVISLIRAGQASAAVYREILSALDAASKVLLLDGENIEIDDGSSGSIVHPLLKILHHDTGVEALDANSLRQKFMNASKIIQTVVSTHNLEQTLDNIDCKTDDDSDGDYISYFGDVVPPAFLERNEAIWRGRVKPSALKHSHRVPLAAKRLADAIAVDFWGVDAVSFDNDGVIDLSDAKESKNPIVQDIFNNLIAIRSIPSWATALNTDKAESDNSNNEANSRYFHPRDRNGKVLRNRYTTERVQESISEYVEACVDARSEVERVLMKLSWDIVDEGHLPAILQASHLNLILSTAAHHAASSNAKGWSTGTIIDDDDHSGVAGQFQGVWPYWMERSESVSNAFDLDGLFLLTAPNMSGKSTLMRSTAAAALLINCGLCAPVSGGSAVRRFDSIFVRGASADVPTEDKSAFGAEMGDVAALLRSCGERSLVFVDEIGRGTSPKDGTSLAGAILEKMAESYMSGMFATHLHGILKLPYSSTAEARLRKKRMAISEYGNGELKWTYTVEDGVCTNSLALLTAAKFGLPKSILQRAEQLSEYWGDVESEDDIEGHRAESGNDTASANNIQHAITILEETVGKRSSIQIPPSYISPPSLEGTSCVYVLQIGEDESKTRYYVGETDSLSQRLSQHRSKGKDWSTLSAVAIQVDNKSLARNVESLVIQQMAKSGFDLVSITDGRSIRHSGRAE